MSNHQHTSQTAESVMTRIPFQAPNEPPHVYGHDGLCPVCDAVLYNTQFTRKARLMKVPGCRDIGDAAPTALHCLPLSQYSVLFSHQTSLQRM